MRQVHSSLKNFNFKGWTADKIVEKYESVLVTRENQVTDLALEIGTISDKFNSLQDQYSLLKNDYLILEDKLQKKEKLLQQELNSKEIMFIRLRKAEADYEELNKKYENLVKIVNSLSEERDLNMNSGNNNQNINNNNQNKNENDNMNINNNNKKISNKN
jgi:chromosome segregation ATPase